MSEIPYTAFGHDELGDSLKSGDVIVCSKCGEEHVVSGGKTLDGEPTDLLLAYRCGDKTYLAGVDSKCIPGVKRK